MSCHYGSGGAGEAPMTQIFRTGFTFSAFQFAASFSRIRWFPYYGAMMRKEDAIEIMHHLASKLEDVLSIEDMVSAFAEFLVHIQPKVTEEDFAFLATVGAMIYLKGGRQYDSSLQADELIEKVREEVRKAVRR
jgi:hypothetical protein